jgi:hypothetical protein
MSNELSSTNVLLQNINQHSFNCRFWNVHSSTYIKEDQIFGLPMKTTHSAFDEAVSIQCILLIWFSVPSTKSIPHRESFRIA